MSVIGEIKEIAGILQKADNIDLYKQVLNLQADIMELMDENRSLKEKIKQLENETQINTKLVFKENMYCIEDESHNLNDKYCTKCWDVDRLLVRLHNTSEMCYKCPNCNTSIIIEKALQVEQKILGFFE